MSDKTLREAAQNLIDSMGPHQDLPPTLSAVDRLRAVLAARPAAPGRVEGPWEPSALPNVAVMLDTAQVVRRAIHGLRDTEVQPVCDTLNRVAATTDPETNDG